MKHGAIACACAPVLLSFVVTGGGVAGRTSARDAAALVPPASGAFGFQLGEQRRYVLGPPDVLAPGVYAEWSIRLDRIDVTPEGERAVFVLGHERFLYRRGATRFPRVIVEAHSEISVTASGFPVAIRTTETMRTLDGGEWIGRIDGEVTYSNGQFERTTVAPGRQRRIEYHSVVRVPSRRYVDLSLLRGVYVLNPSDLTCLGLARTPLTLPCSTVVADGDPSFANPGLLSLVFATLDNQPGGEGRLLAYRLDARISGQPGSFYRRKLVEMSIEETEAVELTMAGRTITAARYKLSGTNNVVFVDPQDSKVLFLEIGRDPRTRKKRHVRLLFPSEY